MNADPTHEALAVGGDWYRLRTTPGKTTAWLEDRDGGKWAELRLLASIDTLEGPDETLDIAGPAVVALPAGGSRLTWDLRSSRWSAKRLVIEAGRGTLAVHAEVEGDGRPTEVELLAGRVILPRTTGHLMSGAWFESIFCSSPTHPGRIMKPASESAVIGVVSGSEAGRGNWFFTPAPFVYAANRTPMGDPVTIPDGPWLTFALDARGGDAGFTGFGYRAVDRGFGFTLDYEAKTPVVGRWRTPSIVIGLATDPYEAIATDRRRLESADSAPVARETPGGPAWWREPIFCGWGAQCAMARAAGLGFGAGPTFATQANYDGFLEALEARGVIPGTVVIDDKWQAAYGTCEPDTGRWPDLRGWIADRRACDQRVLLWYKAWDAEGIPADACIRSAAGVPLGIDPTHPAGEAAIRRAIRTMLAPDGLDADGLKIDFTARTPSGVATVHHGPAWGVDLLRRLLDVMADEAKRVKPEALLVGHTPNPIVASAVDMIRLNDTLRLDDPEPRVDIVPQMTYRARVTRAACPGHLIDTDDWCAPDLAGWRDYASMKASLGVPALYYATGLDLSGEAFGPSDYDLLRETWAAYREATGLPARPRPA